MKPTRLNMQPTRLDALTAANTAANKLASAAAVAAAAADDAATAAADDIADDDEDDDNDDDDDDDGVSASEVVAAPGGINIWKIDVTFLSGISVCFSTNSVFLYGVRVTVFSFTFFISKVCGCLLIPGERMRGL